MKTKIIFIVMISLFLASYNLAAQSIAYKLAVLEKGGYVSENDITVKRFDNLLTQINKKHSLSKEKIGDMTYKLKKVATDRGLTINMIKVMEGATQVKNVKYAEYLGSYLTLLEKGYKHEDILVSLKLLFN